ncbi:hypothetical protein H5410_021643 [Solanum commersonii]|uniref:Uncharacterized protein n=1 Tax=Solanum commersonii TaxID=4109 RepID=A0A9J5ZCI5_SOLCO|nr:hypothetical protein H5410_021643 [Solanum commersonii]
MKIVFGATLAFTRTPKWRRHNFYVRQVEGISRLSKSAETNGFTCGEDMLEYPLESWCKAYFYIVCKNPLVENNVTE